MVGREWWENRCLRFDLRSAEDRYITAPLELAEDGKWHHLAISWDYKTGIRLYVDGRKVGERESTFAPVTAKWLNLGHGQGIGPGIGDCRDLLVLDRMIAEHRERWLDWRCGRIARQWGEYAGILRKARPDLALAVDLYTVLDESTRQSPETPLEEVDYLGEARAYGADVRLLAKIPNAVLMNTFSPGLYRWHRSRRAPFHPGQQVFRTACFSPSAYAQNRLPDPVELVLRVTGNAALTNLATGESVPVREGTVRLRLEGYGLASLWAPAGANRVTGGQAQVPEVATRLQDKLSGLRQALAKADAETQKQAKPRCDLASELIRKGHLSRATHVLEEPWAAALASR